MMRHMRARPTEDQPPEAVVNPRLAARAVLLDPDDRVLLVQFHDAMRNATWWATPGGGLNPGESFEAAVRREVAEETGLHDAQLGPWIWSREHHFEFRGQPFHAVERIFLLRVPAFEPSAAGYTELERVVHRAMRWSTLAELEATQEELSPKLLPSLLRDLLDHGPPAEPIDAGV